MRITPYRITTWLMDDVVLIFVCLLADLILGFVAALWHEKLVDSNSHQLSSYITSKLTNQVSSEGSWFKPYWVLHYLGTQTHYEPPGDSQIAVEVIYIICIYNIYNSVHRGINPPPLKNTTLPLSCQAPSLKLADCPSPSPFLSKSTLYILVFREPPLNVGSFSEPPKY